MDILGLSKRLVLTLAIVAALIGVAAADPPSNRNFFSGTWSGPVYPADLCAFPVTVDATIEGWWGLFIQGQDGRASWTEHRVEQDTFWGPTGKSLTSLPYPYTVKITLEDYGSTVTSFWTEGNPMKVPLPDGGYFKVAGRFNFIDHPDQAWVIPDHGAVVNLEGFCAALEP